MRQFTSKELRKVWKDFYIERGHTDVGAVSLVSDGSTGVMFNVAGMQPLMPYLLGEKHPLGTRLTNVQRNTMLNITSLCGMLAARQMIAKMMGTAPRSPTHETKTRSLKV